MTRSTRKRKVSVKDCQYFLRGMLGSLMSCPVETGCTGVHGDENSIEVPVWKSSIKLQKWKCSGKILNSFFLFGFFPLFFLYLQCSELLWLIFLCQYQMSYLSCHYYVLTLELKKSKSKPLSLGFLLSIRLSYLGSVLWRGNRWNVTLNVNQIWYNWGDGKCTTKNGLCCKKWVVWTESTLLWWKKRETFRLLHGCALATVNET